MKTTQAAPKHKSLRFLLSFLIWLGFTAGLVLTFIYVWQQPIQETGLFQNHAFKALFLVPIGICILTLACWPASAIAGILRARRQVATEAAAIQSINLYRFYKQLPNKYGVGVASLLCNSTIENEKDIIAVILDLCAQKYLHLSKHSDHYVIRVQPNPGKTPLANEAYVLELIQKNRIAQINYQRWYDLCVEDGVELGLYEPRKATSLAKRQPAKNRLPIYIAIAGILLVINLLARILLPDAAEIISGWLALALVITAIMAIYHYFHLTFSGVHRISQDVTQLNYKIYLENQLRRTPKGTAELQKLYAFKNFLAQFNTFVDNNPEAVVIWNRYLSYAQVFGLAKELMQSGHRELIDNATFQIDNIDSISLPQLQLATTPPIA